MDKQIKIGDLVGLNSDSGIYAHFNVFPIGAENIPDPGSNERIDFFSHEIYLYLGTYKWHESVFDMVLFKEKKYVLRAGILAKVNGHVD